MQIEMAQSPPPSGTQIELAHGKQRAVVVEVGGGLRAYEVGGHRLLDGYEVSEMADAGRGQALIPWPNRLADGRYELDGTSLQLALTEPQRANAIHGLVRWANWNVASRSEESVRMRHRLHPQPGYPFELELVLLYELDDYGLAVRLSATNLSASACPFGAGAHPYVTAGTELVDSCTLSAPGGTWMRTDDRAIPTASTLVDGTEYDFLEPREIGATVLDTGYADLRRDADGLARVKLTAPGGSTAVTVWQDESYPYLMLFTGDTIKDAARRRRGLGVEPMTCAPNAFRSGDGLIMLEPGQTFEGSWGISPR
jgi:aldose 1-epimerase